MKAKVKYSNKLKLHYSINGNNVIFEDGCYYSLTELQEIDNRQDIDIIDYHRRKSCKDTNRDINNNYFWEKIFQDSSILSERELIEILCIGNNLELTAKNMTRKLNEILRACNIGLIKDLGDKCPLHKYCIDNKN